MANPEALNTLSVVQSWPPDAESVPLARRALYVMLRTWGMADLAESAGLVLSELMTNALQHARTLGSEIEVRYEPSPEGGLHLEVLDTDSERWPRICPASTHTEHGRGLQLVEAITAGRWGTIRQGCRGKLVWADVGDTT